MLSGNWRLPGSLMLALVFLTVGSPFQRVVAEDKADFGKWEKEIAGFEAQDKEKAPPQKGIVFVGSSSIRLWDLKKSFPDLDVINRGFGGSQIADSVHFADRLIVKHEPRLVVFYAGDNDIAAAKTPDRVAEDFKGLVEIIHKDLPKTKIVFIAIKPSPRRWALVDKQRKANALIEAFCKKVEGLTYLDVATPILGDDGKPRQNLFQKDGLHLNAEGYKLWASLLEPKLK
jgi:lysophospholipase L1-like esterase